MPTTGSRPRPALQAKPEPRRKIPRLVIVLAIAFAAAILLTAGGFTFAATQEQRDPFCASCHTQPETTFFGRETSAVTDLASAHHAKSVRCIDCHSGPGVDGRVRAELLGAHNALAWVTHTAVQPAQITVLLADANCIKCHAQIAGERTMENHFHYFLSQWQGIDPNAARCVDCHEGHHTDGRVDIMWLNETRTQVTCQGCHSRLRGNDSSAADRQPGMIVTNGCWSRPCAMIQLIGPQQVIQRDDLDLPHSVREVRVYADGVDVGDDENRGIIERTVVHQELHIRLIQIDVLALVLPREARLFPNVGPALSAGSLTRALAQITVTAIRPAKAPGRIAAPGDPAGMCNTPGQMSKIPTSEDQRRPQRRTSGR